MTRRRCKQWPGVANAARLASIDEAGMVVRVADDALVAIRERNLDLATALVAQMRSHAQVIVLTLENAPAGPEGEG
jgi:hypothetical protein